MFTRGEAVAVPIVSFLAAAIVPAYLFDTIGLTLHPFAILPIAIVAAGVIGAKMPHTGADLMPFSSIVCGVLAWLLWLAWPHLLPIGRGSDLTHHLLLIDYIDRTGRLVHDRAMAPYLGEMIDYTPGAHLLAVLAGRWTRTDGLHALYPVVALSIALKAAFVFLIARRCLPRDGSNQPLAFAAVLILGLPSAYVLGSFAHDSFIAQVVAELFAVTAWWALVCWDQEPAAVTAAIAGLAGAATFLTWPVWVGPLAMLLATLVAMSRKPSRALSLRHASIAMLPVAVIALVYAARHLGAATIAGATGFALKAAPETAGWLFLGAGAIGAALAATDRRARTIPILLAAIALQAAALVVVARISRAETPYLALKMFYFAVYPLAVAGAYAIGAAIRSASSLAWLAAAGLLIVDGRGLALMPKPRAVVSDDLRDAGRWARSHVPPACVDYLVADDDSAYWLHLVVLGNPRAAPRSIRSDTYDPDKAIVRWILPDGLPYAIAESVDALPRDIRTNVDVLARFGRAAVVKRRGNASCSETRESSGTQNSRSSQK